MDTTGSMIPDHHCCHSTLNDLPPPMLLAGRSAVRRVTAGILARVGNLAKPVEIVNTKVCSIWKVVLCVFCCVLTANKT